MTPIVEAPSRRSGKATIWPATSPWGARLVRNRFRRPRNCMANCATAPLPGNLRARHWHRRGLFGCLSRAPCGRPRWATKLVLSPRCSPPSSFSASPAICSPRISPVAWITPAFSWPRCRLLRARDFVADRQCQQHGDRIFENPGRTDRPNAGRPAQCQPRRSFWPCSAASGKSSDKPLDLFLRDLRGSGSIFRAFTRKASATPEHRPQRRGQSAIGVTRHRPPALCHCSPASPICRPGAHFRPAVSEPYIPDLRCPGRRRHASAAIDIGEQLDP